MLWLDSENDLKKTIAENGHIILNALSNQAVQLTIAQNISLQLDIISHASGNYDIVLSPNSRLAVNWICLDKKNEIRNDFRILLKKNAKCSINAAAIFKKCQNVNYGYLATHQGEDSQSSFNFYGYLSGQTKKKSELCIDFRKGAKGSEGSEHEDVMLLSEKATNICVPRIISAESDATGRHGMSSGHIDDDVRIYLQSRGFNDSQIRKLLAQSRIMNVVEGMNSKKALKYIQEQINVS